jgi:iron complex outermembrane receptor protein
LTGENNFNFGYRERSKYSAQGGGFDLGYTANNLLNVALGVSFNKVDYQMPGALTKVQMEQDRRQYQPAMPAFFMNANSDNDGSDKYTNVNFGIKSFWGSWGQMEINFLYGKKDLQMNIPSWFSYNYSDTNAVTYGITPKYILAKEIFGFHNKVIMGVDYYNEPYKKDIFSDRERILKLSTADFTRDSLGYYIRDEFSLLKNLIFSAGYRFERTSIRGSNVDFSNPANNFTDMENTYNAEAYETGLTWLWGKKSKVFAKYATVYRIPFIDEVASFNGFGGNFLTGLEKEKGISMEAGMEFYPLENLKIGLTLFRIDMEDEIQWVYTSVWTGENQNVGKTRHDGAEFSISYLWEKRAKFYGNFTYHLATFENGANNKKEMPLVPNRMANAGVEIYLPYHLILKPELRYVADAFLSGDNDNNTDKLEAYTLFNIYLYYKPSFGKVSMTAFLGVENIADVKYSSFGIDYVAYGMPNFYYPMPGITFKGGLSFEF